MTSLRWRPLNWCSMWSVRFNQLPIQTWMCFRPVLNQWPLVAMMRTLLPISSILVRGSWLKWTSTELIKNEKISKHNWIVAGGPRCANTNMLAQIWSIVATITMNEHIQRRDTRFSEHSLNLTFSRSDCVLMITVKRALDDLSSSYSLFLPRSFHCQSAEIERENYGASERFLFAVIYTPFLYFAFSDYWTFR